MKIEEIKGHFKEQLSTGCELLFYMVVVESKEDPRRMQVTMFKEETKNLESLCNELKNYEYEKHVGATPKFVQIKRGKV